MSPRPLRGQRRVDLGLDEASPGVVSAIAPPRLVDDAPTGTHAEPQPLQTVGNDEIGAQRALSVADGAAQHGHDAQVALDPRREAPVVRVDVHVGHEIGEHGQLDTGLAERRQDLFDVAEEQAVGADDQHALTFEREAVRVEQVGGAVQGDDGLAGARAALHDEHTRHVGPDDLVLFALDGGDDVGEPARARRLEGATAGRRGR